MISNRLTSVARVGAFLAGGFLLAGTVPSGASAQEVDARWLPLLGCWEVSGSDVESPMLCVRPTSSRDAVEFVTWADGELISTEVIRADGVPRAGSREGCTGQDEAWFSQDGRRVYLKSQYVCEDGERQEATGILAMMNPVEWADIKVVGTGEEKVPWALRYRVARSSKVAEAGMENVVAARALAVKQARIAASAPMSVEDVLEAVEAVDPQGVEALLVERGDAFEVDADMLVRMADAGVPSRVIDLVVAVSYPDRFVVKPGAVEQAPRPDSEPRMAYGRPFGWGWGSMFYDPWYYGYSSMYSPFGYGGYYGYGYGYYRPTTIVIEPRPTEGSGAVGRMVKGQGYTRGGTPSSGGSGAGVRSSGGSASSGGSVSSGGSSSGGSSSSGRTAVRRGGGGGGL